MDDIRVAMVTMMLRDDCFAMVTTLRGCYALFVRFTGDDSGITIFSRSTGSVVVAHYDDGARVSANVFCLCYFFLTHH